MSTCPKASTVNESLVLQNDIQPIPSTQNKLTIGYKNDQVQ